jgi:hypothetical protein
VRGRVRNNTKPLMWSILTRGGPTACAAWAVPQGLQKLRASKKNYIVVVLVNKGCKNNCIATFL